MKIDTALYNNEKRHELEGYFIVDTILSLSHPGTLGFSFCMYLLVDFFDDSIKYSTSTQMPNFEVF